MNKVFGVFRTLMLVSPQHAQQSASYGLDLYSAIAKRLLIGWPASVDSTAQYKDNFSVQ